MSDISVVMPVRDGIKFIEHSLNQISDMAGHGGEVVIIDDGSIDGTYEYCQNFASDKSNFVVTRNPGSGICDALNYGISLSTRNWVARFDVDDWYLPNRLLEQLRIINSTNANVIFSGYTFYSDDAASLGSIPGAVLDLPTKLSLVTGRRTPHPSAIFLKELYIKAGGYKSEDSPAEDLSLWLRMCNFGIFATTEVDLLNYRLSTTSTTIVNREKSIKKRKEILNRYSLKVEYLENALINLDAILHQYSDMRSTGRRIALFIYDIIYFARFYKIRLSVSRRILLYRKLIKLDVLRAIFQLFFEARRRKKFRRDSLYNSNKKSINLGGLNDKIRFAR